jgi:hypothetical protein
MKGSVVAIGSSRGTIGKHQQEGEWTVAADPNKRLMTDGEAVLISDDVNGSRKTDLFVPRPFARARSSSTMMH